MKFKILWQFNQFRSWTFSLIISMVTLIGFAVISTNGSQTSAPTLIIDAGVLSFVFLTKLPTGKWWRRILFEAEMVIGSGVIVIISILLCFVFYTDEAVFWDIYIFLAFIILTSFSHFAVRIFARPASIWNYLRQRHLVWEITHVQLRLVLLAMLGFFAFLLSITISNATSTYEETPDFISNSVTILIAIAGFIGVITGILLFIVIIPASLVSYWTARQITRRLDNLIKVTHSIRETDYSIRVNIEGEDEIARLQTDFNMMMDQLEAAHHALENERDAVGQLLESRRHLFADISHELRTPVAIIRSYLTGQPTNPEDLAIIEREVLRLQALIDDVFTFARADIDQLSYKIKSTEAGGILERTTQAMKKQAWQSRKVDIVLDYQPQLPLVLVDESRLEQVLYNLLHNAIRHTSPGGIIRVSACSEPTMLRIAVQDTGEGITQQDLEHIWDRFYRSETIRAVDSSGSGLGLAVVKEIVEAMHGKVYVNSEVGLGSCFSITLPRAS